MTRQTPSALRRPLEASLLNATSMPWTEAIDRLRSQLGAPGNPSLFPPHFLKVSLRRIGGQVVLFNTGRDLAAVGFLFPRQSSQHLRQMILRFHRIDPDLVVDQAQVCHQVERLLPATRVSFYDPLATHRFAATLQPFGDITIGRPGTEEAADMRSLQCQIWGSGPDFLYPEDMHSADFDSAISWVARAQGQVIGFLAGFWACGPMGLPAPWQQQLGADLRLESQTLGVAPEYRGRGIATILKTVQRQHARQQNIGLITWTVDPLQFGNAVLNYTHLRAVAYQFLPDLYEFRNRLNRLQASRLGIAWLVNSRRVHDVLDRGFRESVFNLSQCPDAVSVNDGWRLRVPSATAPRIAIEIPAYWTALQAEAPREALLWRQATDQLFQRYLGSQPGQYLLTDIARDGARRYLLGQRVSPQLLQQLIEANGDDP